MSTPSVINPNPSVASTVQRVQNDEHPECDDSSLDGSREEYRQAHHIEQDTLNDRADTNKEEPDSDVQHRLAAVRSIPLVGLVRYQQPQSNRDEFRDDEFDVHGYVNSPDFAPDAREPLGSVLPHMDAHVDGSIVDIDVEMVDLRLVDAVVAPI